MKLKEKIVHGIAKLLGVELASVSVKVDDSPGWTSLTGRPHDRDPAELQELYSDALEAWRKNPLAWRIIGIISDYVVGERLRLSSGHPWMARFLDEFWNHRQNRMDLRLESMSDELARSGDLFVLLFRNEADGMSYVRFLTKDRITKITTRENDWEVELEYHEAQMVGDAKVWISPYHPRAEESNAVCLHYSVNRPIGALLGESDLTTMIPWLLRYSRMLEDRVRLHWATRAFLWFVKVQTGRVKEKREQYRQAPEAGSVIVHDAGEEWDVKTPLLRGADASHDLRSVRQMIDAGSGFPPHWRGEPELSNLATAKAMQAPTERHLKRRQKYFAFMLMDIVYQAYQRAVEAGKRRGIKEMDYENLFTVSAPDISRDDNRELSLAARDVSLALSTLEKSMPKKSRSLLRRFVDVVFKSAGEADPEMDLDAIMEEVWGPEGSEPPEEDEEMAVRHGVNGREK